MRLTSPSRSGSCLTRRVARDGISCSGRTREALSRSSSGGATNNGAQAMISTGVYLTKLLEAYGVATVFGIPGVHTVELYRGLAGSAIRHITPRSEQGAGF